MEQSGSVVARPGGGGRAEGVDGKGSLAEQAYRHLCNRIIEGSIDYGESLNIREIAAALRMSSMPVREALKRLEIEGVVTIKPRSVCRVKIPTRQSILSALEMRELLEIHCVETHYPTVTPAELRNLRRVVETMKGIARERKPQVKRYIEVDREFHTQLCAIAGNGYIDKSYRETSLHLNMRHIYNLSVPPDIRRTYREHAELVDALSRHSREAVSIIKGHLARSRGHVLQGSFSS
jgi:DNA-binding GntR family transcriptional regulator